MRWCGFGFGFLTGGSFERARVQLFLESTVCLHARNAAAAILQLLRQRYSKVIEQVRELLVKIIKNGGVDHSSLRLGGSAGYTALQVASRYGHVGIVKWLVDDCGASMTKPVGGNPGKHKGMCALHMASAYGHDAVLQALLSRGCDVNVGVSSAPGIRGKSPGIRGKSALHVAVQYKHLPTMELLIMRGADLEQMNRGRETPLAASVKSNFADGAAALLKRGASLSAAIEPLSGLWSTHQNMMSLLLKHGAQVDSLNSKGHTQLYYAIKSQNVPIVKLLLDSGASLRDGKHPIRGVVPKTKYVVMSPEHAELLALLLDHDTEHDVVFPVLGDRDVLSLCKDDAPRDSSSALCAARMLIRHCFWTYESRDDRGLTSAEYAAIHEDSRFAELLRWAQCQRVFLAAIKNARLGNVPSEEVSDTVLPVTGLSRIGESEDVLWLCAVWVADSEGCRNKEEIEQTRANQRMQSYDDDDLDDYFYRDEYLDEYDTYAYDYTYHY